MADTFIGSVLKINATFKDGTTPFNPTRVEFQLVQPGVKGVHGYVYGVASEVTLAGYVYTFTITLTAPGLYKYRWISTGTNQECAYQGSFTVPPRL